MILVTGATGNVGRELARELAGLEGVRLRILVRDVARAAGLSERVERVVGDLATPATLTSAFEGAEQLFLLTQGIGTDYAANALTAAKAAGVRHIVFVSSYHVAPEFLEGRPLPAMARWHHAREEMVRASGIPATILRPGGFMTNTFDWLSTLREGGYVLDPVGPGRFAPIDPADIASVAALALMSSGHAGKAYPLTGGEMFTVREMVRILGATIGRELEIREVSTAAEAVRFRFPNGAPPALAEALIEGFQIMRRDTAGSRTDTVERLLGRKPRTFAEWCARNAGPFRDAAACPRPRAE